jgi:8-oxo-dGTP diphosphatase
MKHAAVVIIHNDSNEILLCKNGPSARSNIGRWENPGGEIEPGETPDQTIVREIREELDTELVLIEKLLETRDPNWTVTIFSGTIKSQPNILRLDEISQILWVKKSDLKAIDLASYTRTDFQRLGWL